MSQNPLVNFINKPLTSRTMVNIKDHEFEQRTISDSHNRRALQYKNKILAYLKKFKLTEDDIDIPMEQVTWKKKQALVSWYLWDEHLFFSYNGSSKFVDNLAMVEQVIGHFVHSLGSGEITQEKFLQLFKEDHDILKQRKNAREVLGVEEDSTDFKAMHLNYNTLAKKHHPDMPTGNTERFKELNNAHKILKKELI